jgi:hypothetical protein
MRDDIPRLTLLVSLSNGMMGKRADRVPHLVAKNPELFRLVGEIIASGVEADGWRLIGDLYSQATAIRDAEGAIIAIDEALSKEFNRG